MKIKNKLGMLLAGATFAMFLPTQSSACGWWFVAKPIYIQPIVTNVTVEEHENGCQKHTKCKRKHHKCERKHHKKHHKCGCKHHKRHNQCHIGC